ncbi:ComEA family DNA-binding protein [Deferribacter thermophilus]|uniref:ComEA family DNA-binding protein n=1 Tax=Deferribacter thermophilus TaxID=53573 RepID=UPI003C228132
MKKFLFLMIFIFISSVLFAKININTATKEELMSLKGLGKKKAEAIIERREKKPFNSIEELLEIKGVGKRFLEKNKDNICVGSDC